MKPKRFALTFLLAGIEAVYPIHAADISFAAANLPLATQVPASGKAPAFVLGAVILGAPQSGLVAETGEGACTALLTPGPLQVTAPLAIVKAGDAAQVYITAETTTFSGAAALTLEIVQGKASTTELARASVTLAPSNSYTFYSCTPVTLPSFIQPGKAVLVAHMTAGSAHSVSMANIYIR
jgi:hypothetical protein